MMKLIVGEEVVRVINGVVEFVVVVRYCLSLLILEICVFGILVGKKFGGIMVLGIFFSLFGIVNI